MLLRPQHRISNGPFLGVLLRVFADRRSDHCLPAPIGPLLRLMGSPLLVSPIIGLMLWPVGSLSAIGVDVGRNPASSNQWHAAAMALYSARG